MCRHQGRSEWLQHKGLAERTKGSTRLTNIMCVEEAQIRKYLFIAGFLGTPIMALYFDV